MNDATGIIQAIMNLFGIETVPNTVGEFAWCLVVLAVGLFVVKYAMLFILELMRTMVKIR